MSEYLCYIQRDSALDKHVSEMVNMLGVPPWMKGYEYLCRAIKIVYDEPQYAEHIVDGLYAKIACESGTSVSCVERNIRTVLKYVKLANGEALIDEYFSFYFAKTSLSAKKLIIVAAKKLRNDIS